MKLMISGATGLIGKNLIRQALKEGHEIQALVRSPESFKMLPRGQVFKWSHENAIAENAFEGVNAVVHLSGENIADHSWSKDRKKRLVESRINGTKNLVSSLARLPKSKRPQVLISGSAIGYYGYNQDGLLDESSPAGDDFLAELCKNWEQEALKAEELGIRVVLLRTGIVLSKEGGALAKMPAVRISDGLSWMSWIHIQDMVRIILFSLNNAVISGPVNCVAPQAVQNKEFVKELAAAKKIPSLGFVPKTVLQMVLGELANAITSSLKIHSKILSNAGFKFDYPDLHSALTAEFKDFGAFDTVVYKDQFVPLRPEEIFQFFSRAENLETLTPPWLNFKIVSKSSEEIHEGTTIDYKLNIHGIPVKWKTLISAWKKNEFFIDQQTKGPYAKWHHLHTFESVPGGCLLRDIITYRVPVAFFGNVILGHFVAKDVNQIFQYRQERIESLLQNGELK